MDQVWLWLEPGKVRFGYGWDWVRLGLAVFGIG